MIDVNVGVAAAGRTTVRPTRCTSGQFTCNNNLCIPTSWVCDDYPDCEGGEDELDCKGRLRSWGQGHRSRSSQNLLSQGDLAQ